MTNYGCYDKTAKRLAKIKKKSGDMIEIKKPSTCFNQSTATYFFTYVNNAFIMHS